MTDRPERIPSAARLSSTPKGMRCTNASSSNMCPAAVSLCRSRICQSSNVTSTDTAMPMNASDASVDYAALRERLAEQNKVLTNQVTTQRAIVKKNQELLKEAQKLDASNKKLSEEKKKLETPNADLEKQRMALKSSRSPPLTLLHSPAPTKVGLNDWLGLDSTGAPGRR